MTDNDPFSEDPHYHEPTGGVFEIALVVAAMIVGLILLAIVLVRPAHAQQLPTANFAMVVAVDFSGSMSLDEREMAQRAIAEAMRDTAFLQEVSRGCGYMAVTGFWEDQVRPIHGWLLICSAASARQAASALEAADWPIAYGNTNPSGAIDHALNYMAELPGPARRQLINVIGDGVQSQLQPVPFSVLRERAITSGVMVNAIGIGHAAHYFYAREVVTGFAMRANDWRDLVNAMRAKFSMELAAK